MVLMMRRIATTVTPTTSSTPRKTTNDTNAGIHGVVDMVAASISNGGNTQWR